jgi:hypothetical protein
MTPDRSRADDRSHDHQRNADVHPAVKAIVVTIHLEAGNARSPPGQTLGPTGCTSVMYVVPAVVTVLDDSDFG